ncbi:MAG: hypothetical protein H3C47_06510 [Candidatus Cloacimonetes bacterium]|nr:hypothetical protein [Candidatus Cloacimonadota bacterium]
MYLQIRAETSSEIKVGLLKELLCQKPVDADECMAFLEEEAAVSSCTVWRNACRNAVLELRRSACNALSEEAVLAQLQSSFVNDSVKICLLQKHLSLLHSMPSVMDWIHSHRKDENVYLRDSLRKVVLLMNLRRAEDPTTLDFASICGYAEPSSLDDFFALNRLEKLWWLMYTPNLEHKDKFLIVFGIDLLKRETDEFVLSNLVKRIAEAITRTSSLQIELINELTRFLSHSDYRIQANLIEGMDILMQHSFRYRGLLYPLLCQACLSKSNRVSTTAIGVRIKYAPNETQSLLEDKIESASDLRDLESLTWLAYKLADPHALLQKVDYARARLSHG